MRVVGKKSGKRRYSSSRKKRQEELLRRMMIAGLIILGVLLVGLFAVKVLKVDLFGKKNVPQSRKIVAERPELNVQLLTPNEYSRPGMALEQINGIVVHYTANPMSTAQNNRDYFEGLKDSQETKVSSHFIIGLEGEIIQCIPSTEIAYASNSRNIDTLSIECCHPDETGQLNEATYESLVELVAWLCGRFTVENDGIIRHYDVTGKICPKYFVDHEEAWIRFRQDVAAYIEQHGVLEEQTEAAANIPE